MKYAECATTLVFEISYFIDISYYKKANSYLVCCQMHWTEKHKTKNSKFYVK